MRAEGRHRRARGATVPPMAATDDAPQQFANAQYEIYLQGLADVLPEFPITYDGLEAKAREVLPEAAYGYVAGGAGDEHTMRANRQAFDRWRIVPRMLRDVSVRDMRTDLFGAQVQAPLLLAPIGVQSIIHEDGELA